MFSSRLPPRLQANAFAQAVASLRREQVDLLDLTVTNPTRVGLSYPELLLSSLSDVSGLGYDPLPFGLMSARQAVAEAMSQPNLSVAADRVVLTASTSEAYSLLFKLLCDPGDAVLVPQPSYPLFELLTQLDAVTSAPYRLEDHGIWSIDRDSVLAACGPRTKAVLVVSPNNPTGSMLRRDDRQWLVGLAQERELALISDEVFADYPLAPRPDAVSLLGESRVLTFTLGGLSKSAGLPQVKLGWMVVSGPDQDVADALARLEVICDTYLSVSTPVQIAAPKLIVDTVPVRQAIHERLRQNYRTLTEAAASDLGVRVMPPEGGWSALVRVPDTIGEEALVLKILRDAHVIVHPGYFFDCGAGSHLVVSLLPEPEQFGVGIQRALARCGAA